MKKINPILLVSSFALIILLAYKFMKPKPEKIPKYGNYLSCIGHPFDLKVKLKSHFYLVEKALPEAPEDQQRLFWGAAYFQNLYAFTNVLDNNPNGPLKWSTISSDLPNIKIISNEKASYPYSVEMDEEPELIGFPDAPARYLKRLLPLKKIVAGEPARKITYEIEAKLLTCFTEDSAEGFKNLKFPQPLDPYTAYFVFPKSHRVLLKNGTRTAEGVFNPCMNPDSITSSGFNPLGFWNFWRPEAQGHGADKMPFDCTLFYQDGKNITYPQVSYEENAPVKANFINFGHFEKLKRPLKMSIMVGGFESKTYKKLDKPGVEKYVSLYLSGISAVEARKNITDKYDGHFAKLLILLWKIEKHILINDTEISSDELSLNLLLRGKLKLSKKDIELRVSLSPNNPSYAGADIFAKIFHDEFLTSDIVAYEGHATTGVIFEKGLQRLKESNYTPQDNSIDYQVFAIYSCNSTFYYRPDSFPKISNPQFKRDILRTAGNYVDPSSNGSLALIASLDQFLYNESYVPFSFWAKKFKSDNFYVLSNH